MRPFILKTYVSDMTQYIVKKFGLTEEDAMDRVKEICRKRYRPMTAVIVESVTDGRPELKAVDLVSFLDKHQDDIVAPNGSIYCQHDKKTGITIRMILDRLKQRKIIKKDMLRYKAIGDLTNELIAYYQQTLVKIGVNSLPGNYGSSYSIFYDKGNYNGITSSGRGLIGYANTCIEHVLGGNFGWFSIDQWIHHINIHLNRIDKKQVTDVMNRHMLRWVTNEEYCAWVKQMLLIYHKYKDFSRVEELCSKLSKEEVQYFWYYQNLRHIIMENDEVFRPWFNAMFDVKNVVMSDKVKPEDLFKLDGALVTMVNVAFNSLVNSGDPEIQVYDLPGKMPDKAKLFVNIANYVQKELKKVDDIFDLFIFTPLCVPDVQNRKFMQRNSSVISDTDSVIFTVKDWVEWYTHDIYKVMPETYHIACTMIYWITQAVAHALKLYSICHGAKGDRVKDMAMKNEFLYPTMCLADIKKTYAGIVSVQEGVILSEPSTDIKGVQLKGSDICKAATKFAEGFIVDDILKGSLNNKISGHDLIQKVIVFEKRIYDDIVAGKTDWCQPLSIKNKDDYAKPMSSQYFYYLAWQEIFADKYGDIMLPNKVITVPIATPTPEYFEYLKKESPTIGKRFQEFLVKYKKAPSKMSLSPTCGTIPKELIPLVMTRDIIYDNVRPCRLILKQLGISCGFEDDKLLFNEVYGEHSMLSRTVNTTQQKEN